MRKKHTWLLEINSTECHLLFVIRYSLLAIVLLLVSLSFAAPIAAQTGPTNLLVNGDFEWWDWNVNSWPFQDGIPEVQVCPGWRAFYVDSPPDGVTAPESWKRPEFRDVKTAEFPYRVRSGFLAQKYFTFGGQHIAGLYQQVGNITPGTPLRFSVYIHTWGCMAGEEDWNICPTGVKSNNPSPMHTKVGIDPTGGTNPWASTVIWSPEINAYDDWTLFQVDAQAVNSTVTVFTYSYADWFDHVFRIHNDVYIDDASLISLDEMPAATQAPQPTSLPEATSVPVAATPTSTVPQPTAKPFLTPTPDADGAIRHVVQSGETLSVIASLYGVTQDALIQLNTLADANTLEVGDVLIIVPPAPTVTPVPPTPTPEPPTPTLTSQPSATAVPTLVPSTATLQPTVMQITPQATTVQVTPSPTLVAPAAEEPSRVGTTIFLLLAMLAVIAVIVFLVRTVLSLLRTM